MSKWNFADVWEAVADELPNAPALVHGSRTLPGGSSTDGPTTSAGGCSEPASAEQDKLALYLYNCPDYLEATFAAYKIGLVPINTNYRYADDELVYLWENADAVAVVFHGVFVERIEGIRHRVPGVRDWLWVDDGTATCPPWAIPYEEAAETTGRPVAHGHERVRGPVGPRSRRPAHALHRRHDRYAQGCDVASGRPLLPPERRRLPAVSPRRGHRRRPRARWRGRAGHDPAAGLPAHARHRGVHRHGVPERGRPRGHPHVPPVRCRSSCSTPSNGSRSTV